MKHHCPIPGCDKESIYGKDMARHLQRVHHIQAEVSHTDRIRLPWLDLRPPEMLRRP